MTIGTISLLSILLLFSCNKDEKEIARLNVRLMDNPGQYDNVFIDVQGIKIHSNSGGWHSPSNFNAGIYDLLEFNNGMDTLLCSLDLPAGKVSQIRLILGDNNSVVVDGNTSPLETPSAQQSGLKLNLHQDLHANESYTIWLDFDVAKSVVYTGNSSFILKPTIRAFSNLTDGKLKGVVEPMATQPVVYAIQGTDTLSAIPNNDGSFMFCGLGGTYDVAVVPTDSTYQTEQINGVQVTYGAINDLGVITLQP